MVMETPSAQCVGREFVRQYYTLLHEAPEYLHRFYSHNSCFVHGGVEKPGEEQPPVQGQADIHKKILSLNFCDCHAKIRQVDSQSTVGNAVVVQVTGELSNNGQPMRRFMQTFILAPQSPKKYYVHNDIFRYQDEVFHDNDTDTDIQEDIAAEEHFHDSETEHGDLEMPGEHVHDPAVCDVPSFYKETNETTQVAQTTQPILSNGNATGIVEERPDTPEEDKSVEETEEKVEFENEVPVKEFEDVQEPEKIPETEEEPQEEQAQEPKSFSWAFVTSKNTSSSGTSVANKQVPAAPKAVPVHQPAAKPVEKPEAMRDGPKPPREQRDPRPPRRERESSRGTGEPEEFRRSRYPDTHQLFVGNLPHNIKENELKVHFETYGKVVEVRINRKSSSRDVPNFGFVVFEDPQTVLKVLDSKPILFRGEHRLNVEEKKQRSEQMARPVSGNRMGRGGGPGGPGMGRIGGPGGPGGRGGRGGGPGRSERGPSDRGRGGGFGAPRR